MKEKKLTKKEMIEKYQAHTKEMRKTLTAFAARSRLGQIEHRLKNVGELPFALINNVSVIEALLRTVVMDREAAKHGMPASERFDKLYPVYKREGFADLLDKFLAHRSIPRSELVSDDDYELIKLAIEYRNLIIHECTLLNPPTFYDLVDVTSAFISTVFSRVNPEYNRNHTSNRRQTARLKE